MANIGTAAASRSSAASGKQSLLPPKYPFPPTSSPYADYGSKGFKDIPRPKAFERHHQRTSSESFVIEEQPSWLDDLLNEPETPLKRTHRRSTSDSFAYFDGVSLCDIGNVGQDHLGKRNTSAASPWNLQDLQHSSCYEEANLFGRPQQRLSILTEPDGSKPDASIKDERVEYMPDTKSPLEKKEDSLSKQTEADSKRVKQQYAQRSRVRKLQYIAELERHVQDLQAEGLEVSAELEFLDQQNLVLNLENNALKQRLDILAQEKLIKHFQQEMLEREIARLCMLYQQQLLQQQLHEHPCPTHTHGSSRDLNSQFAILSMRNNDKSTGFEPSIGPLDI